MKTRRRQPIPSMMAAIAAVVALAVLLFAPVRAEERRMVAVGDVHGAIEALTGILQRAGLINAQRHWIGGNAILVQTGDVMDRGAAVRASLDFLMTLEREAAAAGGRVQRVLGNHEVMNLAGFTRDATPAIFASWVDGDSEKRRDRAFKEAHKRAGGTLDKAQWYEAHPPGFVEYHEAFGPSGKYGKWLRERPAVVKIEGTIFMHGGIAPDTAASIDQVNGRVRDDLRAWDAGVRWLNQRKLIPPFAKMPEVIAAATAQLTPMIARQQEGTLTPEDRQVAAILQPVATISDSSLFSADGPLWFRGYSTWNDEEGAPLMAALLKQFDARRFVTGHTPQPDGRIRVRFGAALFLIDTGMLGPPYYPEGRPSALEIAGDRLTPVY